MGIGEQWSSYGTRSITAPLLPNTRFRRSLGGLAEPRNSGVAADAARFITGEPNELVGEIHTRMPVILPTETHDRWLSGEAGKEVLRPFPAEEMKIRPVSTRINKPENNDPGILEEDEMEQVGRLI